MTMKEKTAPDRADPAGMEDLVRQAAAGDQGAWEQLYLRTQRDIYRSIRAIVRNEDDAEDILQDAYVRAFERIGQLQEPEKFLPWLRSIAVNTARNHLKAAKPVP